MVEPLVPLLLEATLVTVRSALVTTASVSDAEHTPDTHRVLVLMLLTVAGGVMEAVLVTNGCAWATVE